MGHSLPRDVELMGLQVWLAVPLAYVAWSQACHDARGVMWFDISRAMLTILNESTSVYGTNTVVGQDAPDAGSAFAVVVARSERNAKLAVHPDNASVR